MQIASGQAIQVWVINTGAAAKGPTLATGATTVTGPTTVTGSATITAATGKSCEACHEEHRQKHQDRAGFASASYALDPPLSEQTKNLVASNTDASGLTEADRQMIDQLRARDQEVRDHEQAHARVGGPYAGEPSYSYQTGPDGHRYAIGGEVPIDVSPVADDPEATIAKMLVVKAAALAPAEPSSADRQVASLAEATRMQAIADLAELRQAIRAEPDRGLDIRL